jgi:catalase (peroxidase I)
MKEKMTEEAKCPVPHGVGTAPSTNNKWWPNQLTTAALIHHSEKSNPFGSDLVSSHTSTN